LRAGTQSAIITHPNQWEIETVRFMRTESLIAAVAAVLQIVPFTVGNAQDPRPLTRSESVSIDLATALASSGGLGSEPQILVGALPGWATNNRRVMRPARTSVSLFARAGSRDDAHRSASRAEPRWGTSDQRDPRSRAGYRKVGQAGPASREARASPNALRRVERAGDNAGRRGGRGPD
jgi:hypothetical protein